MADKSPTTFQVREETIKFFEANFKAVMPAAGWLLDVFPDLYRETLDEIDNLLRLDQLKPLKKAIEEEMYDQYRPTGQFLVKALPRMTAQIRDKLKDPPLFSQFAIEFAACRDRGVVSVEPIKGGKKRLYDPSPPIRNFYQNNFSHITQAFSYLIDRFPYFYADALERVSRQEMKKYTNALVIVGVSHPGMLGNALGPLGVSMGLNSLPVFTRACLELKAGIYSSDVPTMLTNSRVKTSVIEDLASAFGSSKKLATEIVLNAAPMLIETTVQRPIDILGTEAVKALISTRAEMFGSKGISGICGEAIKRACWHIPDDVMNRLDLPRESIARALEKLSPFELFCLESLSERYLMEKITRRPS